MRLNAKKPQNLYVNVAYTVVTSTTMTAILDEQWCTESVSILMHRSRQSVRFAWSRYLYEQPLHSNVDTLYVTTALAQSLRIKILDALCVDFVANPSSFL